MEIAEIKYEVKKAGTHEILEHLRSCDQNFIPPLSQRVNLIDYSKKLYDKATTFEAWDNKKLAGMIAAYLNDHETKFGYITSVSLLNEYQRTGIATELLRHCIEYARGNSFKKISLELDRRNMDALRLYLKYNFEIYDTKGEQVFMVLKF